MAPAWAYLGGWIGMLAGDHIAIATQSEELKDVKTTLFVHANSNLCQSTPLYIAEVSK